MNEEIFDYDSRGQMIVYLLNNWTQAQSDERLNKEVIKVYDDVSKLVKCLLHKDLNEINEKASEFQDDEKWEKMTNLIKQIEKQLDQANNGLDKDKITWIAKEIDWKCNEIESISNPDGYRLGFLTKYFHMDVLSYLNGIYQHNHYKHGKKPDNKFYENQFYDAINQRNYWNQVNQQI